MHKMKKLFTEKAEPHNVSFDQMPSEAHNARVKVKQTAQVSRTTFYRLPSRDGSFQDKRNLI